MPGAICLSISSDFPTIEYSRNEKPVILPPGCAMFNALSYRIVDHDENNWDGAGCFLERRHTGSSVGDDDLWRKPHQLGRIVTHTRDISTGPAPLDLQVPPLGPSQLRKSLPERDEAGLRQRIVLAVAHERTEAPHTLR